MFYTKQELAKQLIQAQANCTKTLAPEEEYKALKREIRIKAACCGIPFNEVALDAQTNKPKYLKEIEVENLSRG